MFYLMGILGICAVIGISEIIIIMLRRLGYVRKK
jgi:hypothetical protein